jgi:hypothetical protein
VGPCVKRKMATEADFYIVRKILKDARTFPVAFSRREDVAKVLRRMQRRHSTSIHANLMRLNVGNADVLIPEILTSCPPDQEETAADTLLGCLKFVVKQPMYAYLYVRLITKMRPIHERLVEGICNTFVAGSLNCVRTCPTTLVDRCQNTDYDGFCDMVTAKKELEATIAGVVMLNEVALPRLAGEGDAVRSEVVGVMRDAVLEALELANYFAVDALVASFAKVGSSRCLRGEALAALEQLQEEKFTAAVPMKSRFAMEKVLKWIREQA